MPVDLANISIVHNALCDLLTRIVQQRTSLGSCTTSLILTLTIKWTCVKSYLMRSKTNIQPFSLVIRIIDDKVSLDTGPFGPEYHRRQGFTWHRFLWPGESRMTRIYLTQDYLARWITDNKESLDTGLFCLVNHWWQRFTWHRLLWPAESLTIRIHLTQGPFARWLENLCVALHIEMTCVKPYLVEGWINK